MVDTEQEDDLLEKLEQLPHEKTVIDSQSKGEEVQWKVNWLKKELDDEKKANVVAVNKLNNSLDLIRKIQGYIQQPVDVLNKVRFFDEGFAKNPNTATKVILVLVDFNLKMEEIILDMWGLFEGLEA